MQTKLSEVIIKGIWYLHSLPVTQTAAAPNAFADNMAHSPIGPEKEQFIK